MPFEERGTRTDEYVRAMRILWRDPKPTFHGTYVDFDGAYCQPQPVQRTVPITTSMPASRDEIAELAARGVHRLLVPVTSIPGLPTAISSPDDVRAWRDTLARYAD